MVFGQDNWARAEHDPPVRVAVVDDHELVRSGICNALSHTPDLVVAGEAGDGLAALELLEHEAVDVMLLDLHMPRMDGFACLQAMSENWPNIPVIVLTVDEDKEIALQVMKLGAAAYVPKFVKPADLASLVRQVVSGSVLMGGNLLVGAMRDFEPRSMVSTCSVFPHGLTEREVDVIGLVSEGKSNAQIAQALFISVKTVKYHLTTTFSKLGVRNRTELAAYAITHGLASPPEQTPGSQDR